MLYRCLAAILLIPLLALPAWADEPQAVDAATAKAQLEVAFKIAEVFGVALEEVFQYGEEDE